jgi:hypothetical protein
MCTRSGWLVTLLLMTSTFTANAACEAPEYRQFDFWIGKWEVRKPDGTVAGTNHITREFGGCVLRERYTTPTGYSGESLNAYDPGRKRWHQTWVDVGGAPLLLDGGLQGTAMVLEGSTVDEKGRSTRQRITWTPNPDGTVRQHWQKADEKDEWVTVFDGLYRRLGH